MRKNNYNLFGYGKNVDDKKKYVKHEEVGPNSVARN